MLKRALKEASKFAAALLSVFAPEPKRWEGRVRVVRIEYGDRSETFEVQVMKYIGVQNFEAWKLLQNCVSLNVAMTVAWAHYEKCVMRHEVVAE